MSDIRTVRDNEQKDPRTATSLVKLMSRSAALGSVLDVGCGSGELLKIASLRGAATLCGVDISEYWFEEATRTVPGARIQLANVEDRLPFEPQSFDTIFFCDVIEHLRRPVDALGELRRVLRPNGRVLITTPNANSIVRRATGKDWFGLADPTHILFYTSFTLAHLLGKTGFKIEKIAKYGFTGSPWKDRLLTSIGDGGTLLCIAGAVD
ncbi:MAG: class I SAM-dependent methyltransferase [Candidatus Eremiobacteraeota bacterium]|nr:class I SAM-dependent methyltransferase [Candidatus Eremiobacteraeota bacterium]